MDEAHFGLASRPFVETTDPAAYVPLPSREAALRRLRYALDRGPGLAVLVGPPGAGKSLLARRLAQLAGGPAAVLGFAALPAADLLDLLADELGTPGPRGRPADAVRRLRDALAHAARDGEGSGRPLLVVDDAQLVREPEAFELLRLLVALEGGPALLLVGAPELLLRLPPAVEDRVAVRCQLGPLGRDEGAAYLDGRLRGAGADRPLIEPEAARQLHRAAEGLPRRLNRLADLALLVAAARGADRVDRAAAEVAARELAADALAA